MSNNCMLIKSQVLTNSHHSLLHNLYIKISRIAILQHLSIMCKKSINFSNVTVITNFCNVHKIHILKL